MIVRGFFAKTLPHKTWGPHPKRAEPRGAACLAALVAFAACERAAAPPQPQPGPDGLTALVARKDAAALRATEIDAAAWPRLVSAPYRDHHATYARRFAVAMAPVIAAVEAGGAIAVRRHYADDVALASTLVREKLAVPVGSTTWIVSVDGRDLPAVFAWDGAAWRALVGLDALTRDAIGADDHDCAVAYNAARVGRCLDASAPVAVAALTGDAAARTIACRRLIAMAAAGRCDDRGSVAPITPR